MQTTEGKEHLPTEKQNRIFQNDSKQIKLTHWEVKLAFRSFVGAESLYTRSFDKE